jgi:Fe-S-cluster containining protein
VRPVVRSLSFHARYACRDSGACCSSNWPIPIEADRLARLREAIATGALRPAGGRACDEPADAPAETPALLAVHDSHCVFHDRERHRCRVHDVLGHDALPLACRQFPRVVVHDPRGVAVTLSHYCPTAAGLLDEHERVGIVQSPRAFPAWAEYEGLDARESLPPLLRPDMLMDWESWWLFEERSLDLIGNSSEPVERSLGVLRAVVDRVRGWSPAGRPLRDAVLEAFSESTGLERDTNRAPSRCGEVLAAVPGEFETPSPRGATTTPSVARRFVTAHAFASWIALLGQGLRTWHRSLEAAAALLQSGYDVRQADLLLRHLADPRALAETWSRAEASDG